MRSSFRGLELGVLLTVSASIAAGQTTPSPSAEAPPTAPSSAAPSAGVPASSAAPPAGDPADIETARELFWQAHSYFEKGDYVQALSLFEQTYTLRPEPEVLFNLALTHQRLGHCDQARAHYQEYQARVAPGSGRADVTKQLAELEQQCPPTLPAPTPPTAADTVPAPFSVTVVQPPETRESAPATPPRTPVDAAPAEAFPFRTVGWAAIGVAAAALSASVYFAVERKQAFSDYERLDDDPTPPPDTGDAMDDLEADVQRAEKLAVAMGIASSVFAAGGITLLVLAPNTPAHATAAPAPGLGLGLRWAGSF